MNESEFTVALKQFLSAIGEDPDRPGLEKTGHRVWESMHFLTRGYRESIEEVLECATFEEPARDMVMVRDIEFASICEHHMLPFFGHAHIGYIPDGRLIGLSRIARVVEHFACRLQVQERMTAQIADALVEVLKPKALCVTVSATHMCMSIRGVRKHDSRAVSTAWRGSWAEDESSRAEFIAAVSI